MTNHRSANQNIYEKPSVGIKIPPFCALNQISSGTLNLQEAHWSVYRETLTFSISRRPPPPSSSFPQIARLPASPNPIPHPQIQSRAAPDRAEPSHAPLPNPARSSQIPSSCSRLNALPPLTPPPPPSHASPAQPARSTLAICCRGATHAGRCCRQGGRDPPPPARRGSCGPRGRDPYSALAQSKGALWPLRAQRCRPARPPGQFALISLRLGPRRPSASDP